MNILLSFTELVAIMFGVFGGFVFEIFPVELEKISFGHGFAALLALLIFLSMKLISIYVKSKKCRVLIFLLLFCGSSGSFLWMGSQYWDTLNRWTFRYPNDSGDLFLAGQELTCPARKIAENDKMLTPQSHLALVFRFTANPKEEKDKHKIWTEDGLTESRFDLLQQYVTMVLTLALAIGSGLEAIFIAGWNSAAAGSGRRRCLEE